MNRCFQERKREYLRLRLKFARCGCCLQIDTVCLVCCCCSCCCCKIVTGAKRRFIDLWASGMIDWWLALTFGCIVIFAIQIQPKYKKKSKSEKESTHTHTNSQTQRKLCERERERESQIKRKQRRKLLIDVSWLLIYTKRREAGEEKWRMATRTVGRQKRAHDWNKMYSTKESQQKGKQKNNKTK